MQCCSNGSYRSLSPCRPFPVSLSLLWRCWQYLSYLWSFFQRCSKSKTQVSMGLVPTASGGGCEPPFLGLERAPSDGEALWRGVSWEGDWQGEHSAKGSISITFPSFLPSLHLQTFPQRFPMIFALCWSSGTWLGFGC